MAAARTFKLTSPLMRGGDIRQWQETLNAQLGRWGIPGQLAVDGEYGKNTREWTRRICFGLGIAQRDLRHGVTPQIRRKVRKRDLTRDEKTRYKRRQDWRHRLRLRLTQNRGPQLALKYARRFVGVTERPPGSNRGPQIDEWQRAVNMIAQPWCGAFVAACLRSAGLVPHWRIRYTPFIVADAQAGVNGFEKWIPKGHGDPKPGDLVLFDFDGGVVDHVGIYVGNGVTIEGNTSAGPGGSQSNGGGVFVRKRGTANVRGYARPDWKH